MEEEVKRWLKKKLKEPSANEIKSPTISVQPVQSPIPQPRKIEPQRFEAKVINQQSPPVPSFPAVPIRKETPQTAPHPPQQSQPYQPYQQYPPAQQFRPDRQVQQFPQQIQAARQEKKFETQRGELAQPMFNKAGPKEAQIPLETSPEPKRPFINAKILLSIIFILAIVIAGVYAFIFQLPTVPPLSRKTEYKISLSHNDMPVSMEEVGGNLVYGIQIYNKTGNCPEAFYEIALSSSNHTFDSSLELNKKSLVDYAKENYAFDLYIAANQWDAVMHAATIFDTSSNYEALPKLSEDYTINFDIPIYDYSNLKTVTNLTNLNVHVELADDWRKTVSFTCRLSRNYNSTIDSAVPNCQSGLLFGETEQCAYKLPTKCAPPSKIAFEIYARQNGKNIDCDFPIQKLTANILYELKIRTLENIDTKVVKSSVTQFPSVFIPAQS